MSEEIILEARDIWHSYEENDRFSLQGLDLKVKTVVFCQRGAGNLIRDPESGCCKRTGKNRSGAGDGRTGDRALSKTAGTCVKRRAEKTGLDRGYFSDASGDHHFG